MSDRQAFASLLDGFGALVGMAGLAPDGDGRCGVGFDGAPPVILQHVPRDGTVVAYAVIGTLPEQGRETALALCLSGNLFWQGTAGATLGLDGAEDSLVLARALPLAALDAAALEAEVRRLSDTAGGWRRELADLAERLGGAAAAPMPPAGGFGIRG